MLRNFRQVFKGNQTPTAAIMLMVALSMLAYLAPSPDLRKHATDVIVSEPCTTVSFNPESLSQLSPGTRHRFDAAFIQVLVRRLHAAHEALAHPRKIL